MSEAEARWSARPRSGVVTPGIGYSGNSVVERLPTADEQLPDVDVSLCLLDEPDE